MNINNLQLKSKQLKSQAVKMVFWANSGHPGWSLSSLDLLTILFYWGFLKFDVSKPLWSDRDYFILSKWHISPAYYSILADLGYFPSEELFSFRQINSLLQWHPSSKIPWVEVSTWSLWQWLSVANWIALWLSLDNKDNKIWVLLWDWELQEWQVWEAAMSSAHYKLWNLIAIVDNNGLQIDWKLEDVMNVWDIWEKFKSFWWEVLRTDGHDFDSISKVYNKALEIKWKPVCIVANTIKWKWVSFMENNHWWHWKSPNEEELKIAMKELWN